MPATYEPIATTTLGSTASSVTFSSIPSTYTDLVVVSAPIGNGDAQVQLKFNNDSSAIYSYTILASNGASVVSARAVQAAFIGTDYFFSVTTAGGITLINVMNYANTTTYKTALLRSNNASKATMAIVGLWPSTAAINRIDLTATSSTFAAGSVFTIYGIKAAQTMPNTFVKIASNTLTATASSVTFSSIPQTYTDLVLKVSARDNNGSNWGGGYLRFNGDSSSGNYNGIQLAGLGSSVSTSTGSGSWGTNYMLAGRANGGTSTANTFGNSEIYIPNYTSTTQKSASSDDVTETNATSALMAIVAGSWVGTTAITSIEILTPGALYQINSTFTLYGIKKN